MKKRNRPCDKYPFDKMEVGDTAKILKKWKIAGVRHAASHQKRAHGRVYSISEVTMTIKRLE